MRAARLAAGILSGIGVVTYSAWLLEFVLPTGISPLQQSAEQLLSAQPVFRVALGVSGLAFALAGPPLLRLAPVHWMARLTVGSLGVFSIALFGDAARPGTTAFPLLANLAALAGALSLVLWWPPGWRAWAVVFLALVVLTWLAAVTAALLGPDHLVGLFTRAQMLVRAALILVGVTYVVVTPDPRRLSARA
ncbi:hypothetical protein QRX50_36655 [Amycolatopsis carbonis]|uniref:DUF998 domain-containing protein n=1 Tax=Amycolatopsis carbonis TaxID=715471 RepID=A0A9Y2MTJ2_9PSEU|nr:hypothetical protein [Amycolatopsis sp. 2-15]WIX76913.1 hypothetical protein QRX50_36655 [Amycolatopsis sp. 2-15]